MGTLTERQQEILNLIVGNYVASASPVPSQSIARRRGLGLSSATVRNEMAELEEEGYIRRRHVSGGGIPSDKGYRLHVQTLPEEPSLAGREERHVRTVLGDAPDDVDLWTSRAAEALAELVGNVSVVSRPKAAASKIKRVELVQLQDFLAMLILVLQEARVKQRILHLEEAATQSRLTALSNKFSAAYGGATYAGISRIEPAGSSLEQQVIEATRELLLAEEGERFGEPYATGLRHALSQPEFADASQARVFIDAFEDRQLLQEVLQGQLAESLLSVVIGEEHEVDTFQGSSVIVSRYGSADGVGGYVAIVGPTRMEYGRSIASARLISTFMSRLVESLD